MRQRADQRGQILPELRGEQLRTDKLRTGAGEGIVFCCTRAGEIKGGGEGTPLQTNYPTDRGKQSEMNKANRKLFIILIFTFVVTSCNGHTSVRGAITTPTKNQPSTDFSGEIPGALRNWNIVADVSDKWFDCEYKLLLKYTELSVDIKNQVWIYGPDLFNGPNGGLSDNPGCTGDNSSRILAYDNGRKEFVRINLFQDSNSKLMTASGWAHIDDGDILLNSVLIYKEPWDGENGGKANKIYDLAILNHDSFRDLLSDSGSVFSLRDFVIENNKVFAVYDSVKEASAQILVYDISKEAITLRHPILNCQNPRSIAVSGDDVFVLCQEKAHVYSLYALAYEDFSQIQSWKNEILFTPILINHESGFPLRVDRQGRVWVGFSYLVAKNNGQWNLNEIEPDAKMIISDGQNEYPKVIYSMEPYSNGMIFSVEGGLFYLDGSKNSWEELVYNSPIAIPITVSNDGVVYAFTGKYVISGNPWK